jgi:methionine salvage enolase-phosphatase E1
MKITITPDGDLCNGPEYPAVGRSYNLEDAATGTDAQNRAFHALIGEYWKSGQHSYVAKNYDDFRNQIKRKLGAGFEAYVYVILENGQPIIRDAKLYDEIPAEVRADPEYRSLIRGRLKSWGDYTIKERRETMDKLISEMIQAGVNSAKFAEIMAGMEA